jgi:hypothetical protein
MDFIFLSAYKVLGISPAPGNPDVTLFEGLDPKTRVLLTGNLDQHWHILDRHVALASLMLRSLIGKKLGGEFEEILEKEIADVRERRAKILGNDGILLIEIKGITDANIQDPKKEVAKFVICFDAYDKKILKASLEKRITAVLAAVRIGGAGEYFLEKIAEGSYLLTPDNKVIHSFSPEVGTPSAYASSPINPAQISRIQQFISLISKKDDLASVARLFAHSLDRNANKFRAFVSAWSAMEILINKTFQQYENELIAEVSKITIAPGLKKYLSRNSEVMKGKYSLVDKFAVISIFLNGEKGEDDITLFDSIKKVRDNVFHGQDVVETSLPIRELHGLFEKYFSKHIERASR